MEDAETIEALRVASPKLKTVHPRDVVSYAAWCLYDAGAVAMYLLRLWVVLYMLTPAHLFAQAFEIATPTILPWHRACPDGGKVPRDKRIVATDFYCLNDAHARGVNGSGVRVGLFDAGIWSDWQYLNVTRPGVPGQMAAYSTDHAGRCGSLIASSKPGCKGVAPGVQLFSFEILRDASEQRIDLRLLHRAIDDALAARIDIAVFPNGGEGGTEQMTHFRTEIQRLHDKGIAVFAAAGGSSDPRDMQQLLAPAQFATVTSVGCVYTAGFPTNVFFPFRRPQYPDDEDDGRALPDVCTQCYGVTSAPRFGGCRPSDSGGSSEAAALIAGLYALQLSAIRQNRPAIVGAPYLPHTPTGAIQHGGCGALPSGRTFYAPPGEDLTTVRRIRQVMVPWEHAWDRERSAADAALAERLGCKRRSAPCAGMWTETGV